MIVTEWAAVPELVSTTFGLLCVPITSENASLVEVETPLVKGGAEGVMSVRATGIVAGDPEAPGAVTVMVS